jgi:5-formyltetrahydrofolate cyclo-ligase
MPIKDEVDTRELVRDALREKAVLLPYVAQERIYAGAITDLDDLSRGPYGTLEPATKRPAAEIDLVLVPGVAFDRSRHRLGYGKGYYDAFLRGVPAVKVGVAFARQIVPSIPAEAHDVQMDIVVTEEGVL